MTLFKQKLNYRFLTIVFSFALIFFIFTPAKNALAITDDFTVKALVGEDTLPPTTPVLLSVDPIAPTQIDIVWSSSTDNVLLSGYVLFRDSVAIATTTLTTYIDTDLLPETLYSYEVYAFDAAGNISTTSNSLATTTPAVPVVPPVTPDNQGTSNSNLVFELDRLNITTETNRVFFDWRTNMPSQFLLRWGKNDNYDTGYISGNIFRYEHKTVIDSLEPGSVYLFELIGYTPGGRTLVLERGQFKTLGFESISLSPPNVTNLNLSVGNEDVLLTFELPEEVQNERVRIVRSHLGYPNNIYDGAVVYEGTATSFVDVGALKNYNPQYYTVFVIRADGSISSGAVGRAMKVDGSAGNVPEDILTEPEIILADYDFDTSNINIYQGNNAFNFKSDYIEIDATQSFLLSIPYLSLPQNLKSIVVTLVDPSNQNRTYSFLLKINKERTAYEATIAALNLTGPSRLQIEVFDYERNIAARYRKPVTFIWSQNTPAVIFPDVLVRDYLPNLLKGSAVAVSLGLIFFIVARRRRKQHQYQS